MSEIIHVNKKPVFDESISKKEYHSYSPFLASYDISDEIRFPIHDQNLRIQPSESFIYIEGALVNSKGQKLSSTDISLINNCIAFLFDEIRYEINGVEIDRTRNVGITTTLKNYISLGKDQSDMLYNAGWSSDQTIKVPSGFFNFCIPLRMLQGFAEDYKKIILNARHELIIVRARSNNNSVVTTVDFTLQIHKMQWRVPHINVCDAQRLSLLNLINSGKSINLCFRSWEIYEYPVLPTETSHHVWMVKTSTQLEKPRFVIFALQTNKNNKKEEDPSKFDHCKLTDIKLYLNSEAYPYDDLNLKFSNDRYALLYDMYSRFQESYYGKESQPLLSWEKFKTSAPLVVIDCSHQNEAVKSGPVDVKIEFRTEEKFPANTSAYCLLLHDRIVEYNPLTSIVRKLI